MTANSLSFKDLTPMARNLARKGWGMLHGVSVLIRTPSASAGPWPVARAPGSDYAAFRRLMITPPANNINPAIAIMPHSDNVGMHCPHDC